MTSRFAIRPRALTYTLREGSGRGIRSARAVAPGMRRAQFAEFAGRLNAVWVRLVRVFIINLGEARFIGSAAGARADAESTAIDYK